MRSRKPGQPGQPGSYEEAPSSLTFINRNTRMSRRLLLVLLFIALVALDQVDGGCYPVKCKLSQWTKWGSCRVYGCDGKGLQRRTRYVVTQPRCHGGCPGPRCETRYCKGKVPYGKREMIEANTALQQNGKNDAHILCLIHTQLLYIIRTGFLHPIQ